MPPEPYKVRIVIFTFTVEKMSAQGSLETSSDIGFWVPVYPQTSRQWLVLKKKKRYKQ